MSPTFLGRLAVQQRVLPAYRAPFFEALAGECQAGLSVFAGQPLPEENTTPARRLESAEYFPAHNWNFLHTPSPFYQCWQANGRAWLEHWQPDVLVIEGNPRTPSSRSLRRWMQQRQRPVLGWGLGAPALTGIWKYYRQATRRSFLRPLDGMIAYSRRAAQEYADLGFSPERIFVAPNAVQPRPTWPLPARPQTFTGKPQVLFVGRLQPRKRIDHLLHACAALPPALQPELVIVGDGPARPGFEELARAVYPAARFTGARPGAELEAFFRAADLFVLPGTGGLAAQQAMSYGLPVIVGEGDGTQEDLVTSQTGWLLLGGGPAALERALAEALSQPARLRHMGEAAYRLCCDEANLEVMARAFAAAAAAVKQATTGTPRKAGKR